MMVALAVSILSALVGGGATVMLVRPVPRLAARVRPHLGGASPGAVSDVEPGGERPARKGGSVRAVAVAGVAGALLGLAAGVAAGWPGLGRVALAGLGMAAGAARGAGGSARRVDELRARMVSELVTVNQLLAVRARTGGSVHQALTWLVRRADGVVADEVGHVLRLADAGLPLGEALRLAARTTAEPACARTYRLLAAADERGVDLAGELVRVSRDVRERRRVMLRRHAARRRAAMLVPTIAVLAPVMLLFVGAPLPTMFFDL